MSMFSKLMGRIFGGKKEDVAVDVAAPTPSPAVEDPALERAEATDAEAGIAEEVPAPISVIDVEANLAALAREHPEKLDWKKSIVDLMKLVGMDSSFGARKELAIELGYSEDDIEKKGSAEMNMWLHKQVMKKLEENGGTVPAELLD